MIAGIMIQNRLKIILVERGSNLTRLATELDRHRNTLERFVNEDRKTINVPLMEQICEHLDIQPGDIYRYIPD